MPKETFFRLNAAKKDNILKAFLIEFTINSFDDTSISKVVKELNIAKGSIYQYFDDKLDLYTYLINECATAKKECINIDRANYDNFWAYFRELYVAGYHFDEKHPLKSHFLFRLMQNVNSPSIKALYNNLKQQTINEFIKMAEYEIAKGLFRKDIPVGIMGHMLSKIGETIMEYLEHENIITPGESIQSGVPVFKGKKELLLDVVDAHIRFIRNCFDK